MNEQKILPLAQLSELKNRHPGKRLVLCHGAFDIVHPGHLLHFEEARSQGDILVVTVTADAFINKKKKCLFDQLTRAKSLAALAVVDYVAIVEDKTALPAIRALSPDIYVKGEEYETLEHDKTKNIYEEKNLIDSLGGELYFTHNKIYSSSKISYFSSLMPEASLESLPDDLAPRRHFKNLAGCGWSFLNVKEYLHALSQLDIVLAGETIVDEMIDVRREAFSAKSKCLTGEFLDGKRYIGGTAAVALHLSTFVRSIVLLTNDCPIPRDDFPENIRWISLSPDHIIKTRYRDSDTGKALFELKQTTLGKIDAPPALDRADAILIADFGHGLCDEKLRSTLMAQLPEAHLSIMTQSNSSNYGFNLANKYEKADYFSLNETEGRLLLRDRNSPLPDVATRLSATLTCGNCALTAGKLGAFIMAAHGEPQLVEATSTSVNDPIGCGDSYFAFSALALACKFPLDFSAMMGNLAAGLIGERVFNHPPLQDNEFLQAAKIVL